MSRMAFAIVCVGLGGFSALAVAAPPPTALPSTTGQPLAAPLAAINPVSAEQLQAWVRELDADDYAVRETATRELMKAGPEAIEALARGVVSDSPEAAWRASEALQQIALQGDDTALARSAAALDSASRAGKVGAETIVRDLRVRQQKLRHDRATAKLRALGAKLPGTGDAQPAIWLGGGIMGAPIAVDLGAEMFVEVMAGAEDLGPGRPVIDDAIGDLDTAPEKPMPLQTLEATLERLADLAEQPAEELDVPDSTVPAVEDLELAPSTVEATPALAPPPAAHAPPALLEAPEAGIEEIAAGGPEMPPVADLPFAEPAPPPDDVPIRVEEEALVEHAPDALVADAIFIGDAFGSEVTDSADASGLSESLILDADWKGSDEDLAVLGEIPSLMRLTIDGAPLSEAALAHFAALPKLVELRVKNTKLSAASLYKLRSERKNLQIIAQGPAMLGVHAEMMGACLLTGVYHGSGAEGAGLMTGDEIVAIDGHMVKDFSDLSIAVYPHAPGETIRVEIRRDGKKLAFEVVLKGRTDLGR